MLGDFQPVAAGLMGAFSFGVGDFAGSRASVRIDGTAAVAVSQIFAAGASLVVFALAQGAIPEGPMRSLAAFAGVFHVIAVYFIYQGMARGLVCIVAPVAAVVGIAVPVLADIVFINSVSPVHGAGIALAAAAVVLISRSSDACEQSLLHYSLRIGAASGFCYGLADLCLGLMTEAAAEGGLAVARLTGACLALVAIAAVKTIGAPSSAGAPLPSFNAGPLRFMSGDAPVTQAAVVDGNMMSGLALCAVAGLLDCTGQLGYVWSATQGQMSIAAALVALYPTVSVALAVLVLGERIAPPQLAGIAASTASILLLSW